MLLPQEKKRRREENLKRRLENERKAEIVQVVSPGWGQLAEPADPGAPRSRLLWILSLAPPLKEAVGSTGRTGEIRSNPAEQAAGVLQGGLGGGCSSKLEKTRGEAALGAIRQRNQKPPLSPPTLHPDPEPAEAQAGEEEAAAAGGEAGHAGPAPEGARAAQSSRTVRRETGHGRARPGSRDFCCSRSSPGAFPRLGGRESLPWPSALDGQQDGAGAGYAAPRPAGTSCGSPLALASRPRAGRSSQFAQICFFFIKMSRD